MEHVEYFDIHLVLEDLQVYREGLAPSEELPVVFVRFPIEAIGWLVGERCPEWSEVDDVIEQRKEDIVKWAARAAGGLSPDEFYCISVVFAFEPRGGRVLAGEIGFRRRSPAPEWPISR